MKKLQILSVISCIIALNMFVQAQNKTGTTIATFLKIDPSANYTGMGNTGVALAGKASAMYYNPASLGRLTGFDMEFTMNQWLADITYNYAALAVPFEGIGTFGVDVTALNSGDIAVRSVEQPEGTGEKYTANDFAFGVAFGKMVTDKVSVGVHLSYINQTIWHSTLNAFALSFGVQYRLSESGMLLGASLANYGSSAAYEGRDVYVNYDFNSKKYGDNDQLPAELRTENFGLPTLFRFGISVTFAISEELTMMTAIEALHPNDNDESINLGTELKIMKMIAVRAGFRNLFLPDSEGGLVLGTGLETEVFGNVTFRLDYAYADYGRLAQAHRITVGLGF
ncbi:MAG: PorV/PorQ family protein [Ignavibacteriales bacterium]|nr:PorV/PorQ family protein [Ignavibacteriales bacterium]